MKKIFLLIVTLLLAACNSKTDLGVTPGPGTELSGTYVSTNNKNATIVFKPNNTLEIFNPTSKKTMVAHYEIKDKTISFVIGVSWKIFINSDDSLVLNNAETFIKKQIN